MNGDLYFFFGTLMDRDVLEMVLDRPVPPDQIAPAHLNGFTRVYARGEWFPVLVVDAAARLDGIVTTLGADDVARVAHFEDDDYAVEQMTVTLGDGSTHMACVHMAAKNDLPTDRPWDLEGWQATYKDRFMEMAQAWMAGDPDWPGGID